MSDTRATCWALTINNPNAGDDECIALARQKGWKVEGQLEKGENGTPHYQLLVATPQVRFSAVKKAFPRAYIEVTRNRPALKNYVTKEETREGSLPVEQDRYPSLDKFWSLVTDQWLFTSAPAETPDDLLDREVYPASFFSLSWFDDAVRHLIRRGYRVETIGVNPQTRSAWKLYGRDIVYRSYADKTRQTVENIVAEIDIPTHAIQASSDASSPPSGSQEGRSVHAPSSVCE